MNKTNFKVLMHCGFYVDINKLNSGIYLTSKPYLYKEGETIEKLIEWAKVSIGMGNILSPKYIDNLKECELVSVELKIVGNE